MINRPNRRTLLQGLAFTGASALMTQKPRGARAQESADVLVLGAGLSGLQSAQLLEEMGYRVIVLEGRGRIGGKILTHKTQNGFVELGGQSFGTGYGRMMDAADRNNVELFDYLPRSSAGGGPSLALGEQLIDRDSWPQSPLNPFAEKYKSMMPWEYTAKIIAEGNPLVDPGDWVDPESFKYDTPLYDFLRARGLTDAEINLCYDTNVGYGTSAYDISALMMFFVQSWTKMQQEGPPALLGARRGNSEIVNGMARTLKSEVRLNHDVRSIDVGPDGVDVRCSNGSRYSAKTAICSFPFSTLRTVDISPTLTGTQRRAVKTLPFMKITMVVMETDRPFWESDGFNPSMWTDGPAGSVTATRYGDGVDDVTSLVSWTRGHAAEYLDRLGPETAKKLVIREIENLRPAAKGYLKAAHFHSWGMEAFSAGDWAVFRPGQIADFKNDMANAHGRLFFCGEHTASTNRGMEGAMESAERAAFEAIDVM